MSKRISGLLALGLVGLVASYVSAAPPTQLLLNTDFELGTPPNDPTNWTLSSPDFTGGLKLYHQDGESFGMNARGGSRYLSAATNGYTRWGYAEQAVSVTPGMYDLALSFWARIFADSSAGYPSAVTGMIIVDGEIVASATKSSARTGQGGPQYMHVWTSWKGQINSTLKVRLFGVVDGWGGWGILGIDDVKLYSASCVTQYEVSDTSPDYNTTGLNTTMTISGSNLDRVTHVTLRKTGQGNGGAAPDPVNGNDITYAGSITNQTASSLTVDFATSAALPGVYDLVLDNLDGSEEPVCENPRVIVNGFQMVDSAANPNLLRNGSFEVPEKNGNGQVWFGNYTTYSPPSPQPPYWNQGARVFWLNPHNGWYGWEISEGQGSVIDTETWQTVPVAAGTTVSFTGYVHTGPGTNGAVNQVEVKLLDGDKNGSQLGTSGVQSNLADWTAVNLGGTANSGYVTVLFTAHVQGAANVTPAAVHVDDFSLTVTPKCVAPLRAWLAYPSSGFYNFNSQMTITGGANLDECTAVKLVMIDSSATGNEPEVIVPGTIASQTPFQLVVNFPFGTQFPTGGEYALLLEKPNCLMTNLDFVRVRRSYDATVTSGGQNKAYPPNVPPSFANAFKVVGPNLLVNGSFDEEGQKGGNVIPVKGWSAGAGSTGDAAYIPRYNGLSFNDGVPDVSGHYGWPDPNNADARSFNRGVTEQGGTSSSTQRVIQTVVVVPRYELTLKGYIYGQSTAGIHRHRVILWDGLPDTTILAEFDVDSQVQIEWLAFEKKAFPTGSQVTVEWGHVPNPGGVTGTVATHVDQLELTQEAAPCNPIKLDANNDGFVDQTDFASWQACYTGADSNIAPPPAYCQCFDTRGGANNTGDGKIDTADLVVFQLCANGPMIPVDANDPNCK